MRLSNPPWLGEYVPQGARTVVIRVWAPRYHDLGRLRTQAVFRVHAVLCELVPGAARKQLRTSQAIELLDRIVADSPIAQAKLALARDLIADLHRIDQQRRDAKRRTVQAVAASGTSITSIYGVGPIVAGTVLGYVRDTPPLPHPRPIRLRQRHRPHRGLLRRPGHPPALPPRQPATQPRHPHGRGNPDQPPRQRRTRLLPAQDRRRDGSQGRAPRPETQNQRHAPPADDRRRAPTRHPQWQGAGRQPGNDAVSSVAGSHPDRPALRNSHSRASTNSRTTAGKQPMLTSRPAPARRPTSRSAAGVQVEPPPGPAPRARAGTTLTPASTGHNPRHRSRPPRP